MRTAVLTHPAISAALATAADLLGMEVVFIGGFSGDTFSLERVLRSSDWTAVHEGLTAPRSDSFCRRMLAGGAPHTADAGSSADYADAPLRTALGITSYVGVPITGSDGAVLGSLCGIDRSSVVVEDEAVQVLRRLAEVIAAHVESEQMRGVVIRRTPAGWAVEGDEPEPESEDDLTTAMVLADLLAGDLSPGGRPAKNGAALDELARLRQSVTQLEHALAARVTVEQAIGVLAERQQVSPRAAFETLRKVARGRGRRVHDLAREVVGSATSRTVELPAELR